MKLNIILFAFFLIEFVQSVSLVDPILPSSSSLVTITPKIIDENSKTHRLPNNSIPLRYDLWLKTEVDQKIFNFSGRVKIYIKVLEPTQIITLKYWKIVITKINLLDAGGALISENLVFDYDKDFEFLKITLPAQVIVDDELILEITYTGELGSYYQGFYRGIYHDIENDKVIYYARTQFQMSNARHAMPCYDEPKFRAVIGLKIQHTKNYHAISNMPVVSRTDVDGTDHVTTKFQDTISIQTYLLAFIIANLEFVSNNDSITEQRIYAKPAKIKRGDADFALGVVGPVLRKMEEVFEISYPLPKMDHAAIDYFVHGAMENIGLVIYDPTNLLYHQTSPNAALKIKIIQVISHELAHQFFGNIVAPNWWSYAWLNEGFATLFEYYIPCLIYPDNRHIERMRTFVDVAFRVDGMKNAEPLNFYVETPEKIFLKFNDITNSKGAAMLLMFMESMTVPTFMKGIKFYLTDMYLKSATPDDLHRNLQKAYDEDFPGNNVNLGAMMSTWEDQTGYPMIHVTKTNGGFHLNQSRFGGGSEIYSIPISYTTNSELDFETKTAKLWMTTPSATIESNDDWMILNIQSTGYYKVSYSNEIWESFIETLNNNHTIIPLPYRVQLSREMMTALKEGSIAATSGLSMIKYLKNEKALEAWREVSDLDEFHRDSLFGTEFYDDYLALLRSVTKPHLDRLGFTMLEGESSEDSEFRKLLKPLSCVALDPSCLDFEGQRHISANFKPFELCASLRKASADKYGFFLYRLLLKIGDEDSHIDGLSCSLNAESLKKLLETMIDSNNKLDEDSRRIIFAKTLTKSSVGFKTTMDFTKKHFKKVYKS